MYVCACACACTPITLSNFIFLERKRLGIGQSQEMNTLFRFWSFFLRTHFNRLACLAMPPPLPLFSSCHTVIPLFATLCVTMTLSFLLSRRMYEEFKNLALEDGQAGYRLAIIIEVHLYIFTAPIIQIYEIISSLTGMAWSAYSGSIVTVWRRSSVRTCSRTSRRRH